jgi:hypothetical protein
MNRDLLWRYALGALLLTLLVMLYRLFGAPSGPHLSDAGLLLNLGIVASLASLLLMPTTQHPIRVWTNGLLTATIFLLFSLISATGPLPLGILIKSALAVFSITVLLHNLAGLLQRLGRNSGFAAPTILLIALFVGSSILWLGPAVELWVLDSGFPDMIVAGNPLSYLSVALDYDYLRSDWFYRHSPFGSLRFSYPSFTSLTAVYLGLAIGLQGLIHWWNPTSPLDPGD